MALIELSDMCGAIEGYLANYYPDTRLSDLERGLAVAQIKPLLDAVEMYLSQSDKLNANDLEIFSQITQRAFRNGRR